MIVSLNSPPRYDNTAKASTPPVGTQDDRLEWYCRKLHGGNLCNLWNLHKPMFVPFIKPYIAFGQTLAKQTTNLPPKQRSNNCQMSEVRLTYKYLIFSSVSHGIILSKLTVIMYLQVRGFKLIICNFNTEINCRRRLAIVKTTLRATTNHLLVFCTKKRWQNKKHHTINNM